MKFYFDAGEAEKAYDPKAGTANLVEATRLFAQALQNKGHTVAEFVVTPGGHDADVDGKYS